MTNEVLQSDIDLVRRLIDVGRPDAEIVTALAYRKISTHRAVQLVSDLRQGRRVEPDVPEMGSVARTPRRTVVASDSHHPSKSDAEQYSAHQSKGNIPWFMAALLVALAICAGAVIFSNHRAHARLAASRAASVEDAAAPGAAADPETLRALARSAGAANNVSVELRRDGLYLGSRLLNRANALQMLTQAFGAPSRTNQVEGSGKIMYAYDQQGLVIHCQKEKQNDCLVVYFDAIGGENGARQPFSGVFKVGGHVVQGGTDPKTLVSFKELGLTDPGTSSVVETQCHGVPVSFAYLATPNRLSLVQIDLK